MSASTSCPRSALGGRRPNPPHDDLRGPERRVLRPRPHADGRLAASAAEKRLEEIAEPGAAEFELNAAAVPPGVTAESPARSAPSPIRRRLKSARLIPVRAELIVPGAFLGITQDLVSLVDLFEFLLSRDFFFGLGHVGMMFARELTKSAFDFIGTCRLRNTQRLVVIPELNRHKSCG